MARNRKRAKERRGRRAAGDAAPGVATARAQRAADASDSLDSPTDSPDSRTDSLDSPDSLHSREDAPDSPQPDSLDGADSLNAADSLDGADSPHAPDPLDAPDSLDAPDPLEHATPDVELAQAQLAVGRPDLVEGSQADLDEFELEVGLAADRSSGRNGADRGDGGSSGGELTAPDPAVVERRRLSGNRIINFLQGSWRELQRVQWPDRRQVIQATGVVIGFVIVAGVYLGVADEVSSKIVTFILK